MWYNTGMKSAKKAVKKAAAARRKAAVKKTARVGRKAAARENDGLLVEIKNLGPLTRADLRLKNLTVLAGPNKAGKTFASKALHSVFGALNANHAEMFFHGHAEHIRKAARDLWQQMPLSVRFPRAREARRMMGRGRNGRAALRDFLVEIEGRLDEIGGDISSMPSKGRDDAAATAEHLSEQCAALSAFYLEREQDLVKAALSNGGDNSRMEIVRGCAASLKKAIAVMADVPWANGKDMFIREGGGRAFFRNIRSNFQVRPSRLPKGLKGAASIKIEGLAEFTVRRDSAAFKFSRTALRLMQERSRVLFLDSPIYWRLKSPLIRASFPSPSLGRREMGMGGVPQYFYDLVALLNSGEADEPSFPKLHRELESTIGGKIILSKTGMMLQFVEDGIEHPLHSTASGVVNLGFLSFLLEKNLIDKDTYVFIDEPESNLHPEWQVKMAETLYELARAGVHIVLATHSNNILKRLEIYANEESDAEELVAVNHFRKDGIVEDDGKPLDAKLAAVMEELSAPFFGLYMRGL